MRQGKCNTCRIRYVWDIERSGRNCFCPECGGKLQATSSQSKMRVVERCPIGMVAAFEIIRERIRKRKALQTIDKMTREGKLTHRERFIVLETKGLPPFEKGG